ncbi:MAG TPA: hypothetical protein VJ326_09185 [Thermoplasmata archaeon]|jgi:chromosome segregation ATPase|nr:hypothetical protein [Thermoplasmata archaeon]
MDPSNVLLALDEQKKWRERRKRLEEQLAQHARRRTFLLRDLEHVRKKISDYAAIAIETRTPPSPIDPAMPAISYLR